MARQSIDLSSRVGEIMRIAEEYGAEKNYLFIVTFKTLQDVMQTMKKLMAEINSRDAIVTKEYVKGRQNLYVNPAVSEYNKTTKTFNDTVQTLMRVIDGFKADEGEADAADPLLAALRGEDVG